MSTRLSVQRDLSYNHLVALRANLHDYHLARLGIQSGDAVSGVCAVEQLAVERQHLDGGVAAETGYGDLSVGSRNHWLSGSLGLFDAGGESLEFAESAPGGGSLVCIHRLARHIERHVFYRRIIKCARMRFRNIHCLTIYVFQRLALTECTNSDAIHRTWYYDGFKIAAILEGTMFDGGHRIRYFNRLKVSTIRKQTTLNGLQRIWKDD